MYLDQIKKIAAKILFLDDENLISVDDSLDTIGMTSIDFIDFCFQIQSETGLVVEPNHLWPFGEMLADPTIFLNGNWTEAGLGQAADLLGIAASEISDATNLKKFWTLSFCAARLEKLSNA